MLSAIDSTDIRVVVVVHVECALYRQGRCTRDVEIILHERELDLEVADIRVAAGGGGGGKA
jgi:hypothetical protein